MGAVAAVLIFHGLRPFLRHFFCKLRGASAKSPGIFPAALGARLIPGRVLHRGTVPMGAFLWQPFHLAVQHKPDPVHGLLYPPFFLPPIVVWGLVRAPIMGVLPAVPFVRVASHAVLGGIPPVVIVLPAPPVSETAFLWGVTWKLPGVSVVILGPAIPALGIGVFPAPAGVGTHQQHPS